MGDAWGPGLARRLEREAKVVLERHGHRHAQIQIERDGRGVAVRVSIPKGPTRVEQVVLRLG